VMDPQTMLPIECAQVITEYIEIVYTGSGDRQGQAFSPLQFLHTHTPQDSLQHE